MSKNWGNAALLVLVFALCLAHVPCLHGATPEARKPRPFDFFNVEAAANDFTNAYLLAYLNYYSTNTSLGAKNFDEFMDRFKAMFRPLGIINFDFISIRSKTADTQALVLSNNRTVWVIFRGSENSDSDVNEGAIKAYYDWILTDFNIFKVRVPGEAKNVRVHRGFWNALAVAYPPLKRQITSHLKGGRKIWVTGFSLGGALATVGSYRLIGEGFPVKGTVAFGCPRTGNRAFIRKLNRMLPLYQRWIYDRDLVTMMPPFILGFRHAGKNQLIKADGSIKLDAFRIPLFGKSKSHNMTLYLKHLYAALDPKVRPFLPQPPQVLEMREDLALEKAMREVETQKPDGN